MTLNPFRKYRLFTELNTDQVISNIKKNIGPVDYLKLGGSPSNLLEGKATNASFKIKRNITYRNPSIPIAIGKLSRFKSTTVINVLIRPTLPILIFFLLWNSTSLIIAITGLFFGILASQWILFFIGLIFLFFGIAFLNPGDNKEYVKILNIIKELSEIKTVHNNGEHEEPL
jgi:hypothetical protein